MPRKNNPTPAEKALMEEIGKLLVLARNGAGLTQLRVAKELGLSIGTIANAERACQWLPVTKIHALLKLYSISISDFFNHVEKGLKERNSSYEKNNSHI